RKKGGPDNPARLDPAQGRRRGRRTRVARWGDPNDVHGRTGNDLSRSANVRGRRVGGRADPFSQGAASASQTGWRTGGASDRAGVQQTTRGPLPLDPPTVGQQTGGVGVQRSGFSRDRAADAKKNELKPWLVKMW